MCCGVLSEAQHVSLGPFQECHIKYLCVCVPHLSSVTFCAGFHVFVSTYTMTSLVPTHLPSTGAFEVCLTSSEQRARRLLMCQEKRYRFDPATSCSPMLTTCGFKSLICNSLPALCYSDSESHIIIYATNFGSCLCHNPYCLFSFAMISPV